MTLRRRRARQPLSLTAAAQRVDARNPASFRTTSTLGTQAAVDWQTDAKVCLQRVGELEYYVSWRAASASRCQMVASALDDKGTPTGGIPDDDPNADTVREIVRDIAGGAVGQIKIMRRAAYLLTVVGECWIGLVVRDASRETSIDGNAPVDLTRPGYQLEQWYVFGRDEIKAGSSNIELRLPDGTKHEFNPETDLLFRVWDEHPFDPSKPVSPVWSNLDVLHSIIKSAMTIDQANDSRLIGNGIMFVPQEMSLPQQAYAPVAVPIGEPDDNTPIAYVEPNSAQALSDLIYDVSVAAKRDPKSQAAMNPIIAAVPGDQIKNVNWMRPGSDIPETTLKIEEFDIRRLATGLHVSPERLLGMSQGNHWSGWLVDEQDIKIHIAPVVEIIVSAMSQEVLRQKLVEKGLEPDAYVIWYDSSNLTEDPDKSEEAQQVFDRGGISARALRQRNGFDETEGYDYTKAEGWVEMATDRIAAGATNAAMFVPILEKALEKLGLEMATPQPALPPGGTPAEDQAPADAEPQDQPSSDEQAQTASAAAMTVFRLCVNRAMELANKRRRTRANSELFRVTDIMAAHRQLDPVEMGAVDGLIKGWETGLTDSDLMELGLDPSGFRSVVYGVCSIALVTGGDPVLTASMLRRLPRVPA